MYNPVYDSYDNNSNSIGRLPPIRAIGRTRPVDEDDPPDFPDVEEFNGYGSHATSSTESVFDCSDGEDVCRLLHKAFHALGPGFHACKRRPEHGGSHFVHCHRAVRAGKSYAHLRRLLEERALIELIRDCVYRLQAFQLFIAELESLLKAEHKTVYAIRHGCMQQTPVSKLYCLNALCEDMRTHLSHWNFIKQRMNSCRRLRSVRGFLNKDIVSVQKTFTSYCDSAMYFMDSLVHAGLEVLAHCDPNSLTSDILWNMTRGLEEFNSLISVKNMQSKLGNLRKIHKSPSHHSSQFVLSGLLSEGIKAIPFNKVLAILANERSRYAAKLTHHFFTTNEAFLATLSPSSKDPKFHWEEDEGSTVSNICLQSQVPSNHNCPLQPEHSHQKQNPDVRGSLTSLGDNVLTIGSLQVPDLSVLPPPLKEFLHQEQQFSENFLQVVCSSTNLLRPKESLPGRKTNSKHKQDGFSSSVNPIAGRLARVQSDNPVFSRSESRRKTVSWGDSVEPSVRSHTTRVYMNLLWQQFGRNLDLFLDEPSWARKQGLLQSNVGTIFLYSDATLAVLRHMIEHTCFKDMFPSGSVSPLLGVVMRFHALSAFAAWDMYVCSANSSHGLDRCYPCALREEDQYSTGSGQLLQDSHRPLLSLLQEIGRGASSDQHEYFDLTSQYDLDLGLVSGISSRLLLSCQLSHKWCANKLHHSLSSWHTETYLFLSNTDLKMLKKIGQQLCQLLQSLLNGRWQSPSHTSLLDQLSITHIAECTQQLGLLVTQLQMLEDHSMKQFTERLGELAASFFQENLPPAKFWRRKVPPEFPEDANSYVPPIWDGLLAPITEAVAKVPEASQLEVLSSAIGCVCAAWTSAFLKGKIKFSFYGAQQLGVDFDYLRTCLSECCVKEEVRRELIVLPALRQLIGIAQLLKQQPVRRPTSRFRQCSAEDLSCDAGDVTPSASRSELPANMEESQESNDICLVPNQEQWLALRAIGGSRNWHLPACFK